MVEKAIEILHPCHWNQKDTVYCENLSSAYREMGNFAAAIHSLEDAVKIDPRCDTSWNNLGSALFRSSRIRQSN